LIAKRQLTHFKKVHPDYEAGVRRALEHMTRTKASETAQQQIMPQGLEACTCKEAGALASAGRSV
jgi:catalase